MRTRPITGVGGALLTVCCTVACNGTDVGEIAGY
jgi:hypothetical protein